MLRGGGGKDWGLGGSLREETSSCKRQPGPIFLLSPGLPTGEKGSGVGPQQEGVRLCVQKALVLQWEVEGT